MAFNPETLSVMVQPIGGVGMRFVSYRSDDAIGTVSGSGYFAGGESYGLRLHDLVFVSPVSGSVEPYILVVTAVDSDGSVTATQTIFDEDLTALVGLDTADGNFIVGNGTTWVAEGGATARASLGLTIGTHVQAYSSNLALWSAESPTGYLTTASAASTYLTQAAAALAYQPVNVVLLAIAELAATSYGLDLLELADASAGRTALQLGAAATRAVATFGEYNSATSTRALGNESVWADLAVLTDAATIAVDMNAGYDFGGASNAALALGGDRTLGAPSNVRNGKKGILWFTASGSTRTLTLNAAWVLASGVETGPYSITTSQTVGVAYVCRGTNVVVTSIVRIG